MSLRDTVTRTPSRYTGDFRADRVRAAWADVHIDVVETAPCDRGCCVRAVVRLVGLTPADVVVRLTPAAQAAARDWPPEWRMWSTVPYGNGCFLFERVIPRGGDTAGEWVVAVHPASAPVGPPVVCPVRLGSATCETSERA